MRWKHHCKLGLCPGNPGKGTPDAAHGIALVSLRWVATNRI